MSGNVVRPSAFNRGAETGVVADVPAKNDIKGFKDLSWEKDVQIVQLRAHEANLQAELAEKMRQLDELHTVHASEQAEVQRIREILGAHDARINEVKTDFNRKLARMSDQVWSKDIEIKTLVSDLDETSIRLRQTETQRLELETRTQMSAMQLAEATRELSRAHDQFEELETAAKDHYESHQGELSSLRIAHAEESQRLTVAIGNSQSQVHRLEVERERLVAEVNKQTLSAKALRERVDTLQGEIDQRNSSRTYELSKATEEYSLAIAKIAEQHNHDIQKIQNFSANEKQGLIDRAARQLRQVQDESAAQIASLKQMYETVLSGSKEAETKFTVQINRLREQSIEQMQSIEELGLKNHELQRSMLAEKAAHGSMSEELTRKRQLLASLVEEIEGLRTAKAAMAKELATDKIEKNAAGQEVNHLAKALRVAQESVETLEAKLAESAELLSEQSKEFAECEAMRAGAVREVEILTKQLQDQAAVIETIATEAASVRDTLAEEQNLRRLEIVTARREADESAGKISELQIRIRSVEFELKTTRDKFTLRNIEFDQERKALTERVSAQAAHLNHREAELRVEFENERTSLNERMSVLNLHFAQRETELRAEIATADASMKSMRDSFAQERSEVVEQLETEMASMKAELRAVIADHEAKFEQQTREMHSKSRELNAEKAKLESRLQFATENVSNLECRIVALNNQSIEQTSRQSDTESKLKTEVDQSRIFVRMANEETDRARAEAAEALKKQKLEAETKLKAELEQARLTLRQANDETDRARNEATEAIKKLKLEADAKIKAELDQARAAIRQSNDEADRARNESTEAVKKMKLEADGAMAKLGESYQQRIEKDEREIAALKKKLAAQSVQTESAERANETRSTEIAQREEQLRQYANFVTDQKAELVRQTRKLAEEIEMTGRMHPLRDYLELTEFELSKTEVQLKVTPTLSMDRARLEAQIVQLTEQRQFLRSVIDAASTRLSEQAAGILALVSSPSLGATPPIPPKMKTTTEGASAAPAPTVVVPIKRPFSPNPNS